MAHIKKIWVNCFDQEAMDNDELDKKSDELEVNYEKAADAYCLPCLQPPDFLLASTSTSTQPLVIST